MKKEITMGELAHICMDALEVKEKDFFSRSRKKEAAFARMVFCHLYTEQMGYFAPSALGRFLDRDHSTICKNQRKFSEDIEYGDGDTIESLNICKKALEQYKKTTSKDLDFSGFLDTLAVDCLTKQKIINKVNQIYEI